MEFIQGTVRFAQILNTHSIGRHLLILMFLFLGVQAYGARIVPLPQYSLMWLGDPTFSNGIPNLYKLPLADGLPGFEMNHYAHNGNFESFSDSLRKLAAHANYTQAEMHINLVSHGRPGQFLTAYTQPSNGLVYPGAKIPFKDIAEVIADVAVKNPNLVFNINIVTCYSGSFIPIFQEALREAMLANRTIISRLSSFIKRARLPEINITTSTDGQSQASVYFGKVVFDSEAASAIRQKRAITEKFPEVFNELSSHEFFRRILSLGSRNPGVPDQYGRVADQHMTWSSIKDTSEWTAKELLALLATDSTQGPRRQKIVEHLTTIGTYAELQVIANSMRLDLEKIAAEDLEKLSNARGSVNRAGNLEAIGGKAKCSVLFGRGGL